MGGSIEIEMLKPVNQSYLTSLWNQEAFRKDRRARFENLTDRFSQPFTLSVVAIALSAAVIWWWRGESVRALTAFASVLIVACPCALALAAPFALGTALRLLGHRRIFLKGPSVLEQLARVDAVVFDKTGTLTTTGNQSVRFDGVPLNAAEARALFSITRHSTHPFAVRISEAMAEGLFPEEVRSFLETSGKGIEGRVNGREIWLGSAAWLRSRGANVPDSSAVEGGNVQVAIDGKFRGTFRVAGEVRPATGAMLKGLTGIRAIALLSGDNARERDRFAALLGSSATLRFQQGPIDKLDFVHNLQREGRAVLMVGDGLNDAGALKQSDVGLAVVEDVGAFSPASDGIIAASEVPKLDGLLRYARASVKVVRAGLLLSIAYNVVGLSLAVQGILSPVFCAVLMPLSSITVVALTTGLATWSARTYLPVQRNGDIPVAQSEKATGMSPFPSGAISPSLVTGRNPEVLP
jgi:Cu+-exporting ATPase